MITDNYGLEQGGDKIGGLDSGISFSFPFHFLSFSDKRKGVEKGGGKRSIIRS